MSKETLLPKKEEAPDYHFMIHLNQSSLYEPLEDIFSRIYMWLGKKYWGKKADWLKDGSSKNKSNI